MLGTRALFSSGLRSSDLSASCASAHTTGSVTSRLPGIAPAPPLRVPDTQSAGGRRQRLHAITWSCACTAVPPHDMVRQGWRALAPCPGATASRQGCKMQFETHDAPAGELVAGEPAGGAAVRGARGGGGAGGEGAQGRAPRPAAGQGRQRPARRAHGRAAGGPGGGQGRPDAGEGFGFGLVHPERAHSHSGKTSRHPAESQRCLLAEVPGAAGLPDHLLQHGWCASCRSS